MGMMPAMMGQMMPMMMKGMKDIMKEHGMENLLPNMMSKMMPIMLEGVDKDAMVEHKNKMLGKVLENERANEAIPEMQSRMMPGCIERMLPALTDDNRRQYLEHVMGLLFSKGMPGMSRDAKLAPATEILDKQEV
ncbi:hypothetical protein GF324_08910 [bacterium]|nr:hypothetical protein [bacterium]